MDNKLKIISKSKSHANTNKNKNVDIQDLLYKINKLSIIENMNVDNKIIFKINSTTVEDKVYNVVITNYANRVEFE